MNATSSLVVQWADFIEEHPDAGIDDFCRYYLTHNSKKYNKEKILGGVIPAVASGVLIKLLRRIVKLYQDYATRALKKCGISGFEEFVFLNAIGSIKEHRKTEVIYRNLAELSSGLLVIDRLKNRGYVSEQKDDKDKRSKRVMLTKKGEDALKFCRQQLLLVNEIFFQNFPEDDIQLCVHLLNPLEMKFSSLWQEHKNIPVEEIHRRMTAAKKKTSKPA